MKKIISILMSSLCISSVFASPVHSMLPTIPAPANTELIYETHFNQTDEGSKKTEFYMELFMGKPFWRDEKNKKSPAVLVKGRSFDGDKIEKFDALYVIVGSECDQLEGKIEKLNTLTHISLKAPSPWSYNNTAPKKGTKLYTDATSYEVIATEMCKVLNPKFSTQYNKSIKK